MLKQIHGDCVPMIQNEDKKTFSASITITDVIKNNISEVLITNIDTLQKINIPEGTFEDVWYKLNKLKKIYPK